MKETPDGENSCVLACAEGTGESFSRLVDGRVPSLFPGEVFSPKIQISAIFPTWCRRTRYCNVRVMSLSLVYVDNYHIIKEEGTR